MTMILPCSYGAHQHWITIKDVTCTLNINIISSQYFSYNVIPVTVIASTTLTKNKKLLSALFTVLAEDVGISELLIRSQQVCG